MAETKTSVEEALVERISRCAGIAFGDHVVTERWSGDGYGSWRCGREGGSSNYYFNVSVEPGRVFVTGDIGELIVERSTPMLPWVRGAIDSISYFAEKVPSSMKTRQWCPDVSRELLDELENDPHGSFDNHTYEEQMAIKEKISEVRWNLDDGEHIFKQTLYESGLFDGADFPLCDSWNPRFLWCREALKWFLANTEP